MARVLIFALLISSALSRHECERRCLEGQSPRDCRYVFTLQTHSRLTCGSSCPNLSSECEDQCVTSRSKFLSVNKELPGPTIQVCKGDRVEVQVRNRLPGGAEAALHWHGITQRDSPHMDGVPMVTQCPVPPGADFTYRFIADKQGTHFYHAHSVVQQSDGLYGALIVHGSADEIKSEHVLVMAAWTGSLQTAAYGAPEGHLLGHASPSAILINGLGSFIDENSKKIQPARFLVRVGEKSVLRLVNAAALECPMHMSLESHLLRVIRVEGAEVKPVIVNAIHIFPGERYDVEVLGIHSSGEYSLHVKGGQACEGTPTQTAIFQYTGATSAPFPTRGLQSQYQVVSSSCPENDINTLCSLELEATGSILVHKTPEHSFFLPFGRTSVSPVIGNDLEFRFVLDDVAYYPTFLNAAGNAEQRVPHLNHVTFRLPASPPLVHPEDDVASSRGECESYVSADDQETPARRPLPACKGSPHYCECTHVIRVPLNTTLEITLQHKVSESEGAQTFHLHGYKFEVTRWRGQNTSEWHHVLHPTPRDTAVVPRGGAISLVLTTSNPGFWLLESRSSHVTSAGVGMAAILQVGDRTQIPEVPRNFPRCSGLRPEDVIF